MKKIPLTRGLYTIVDDEDYEKLLRYKWVVKPTRIKGEFYAKRGTSNGKGSVSHYMHREILNPPKGMEVDHKNGNKLDNRRSNLRLCTSSQNNANRVKRRKNKENYKGIQLNITGKKWTACIKVKNKGYYLGSFISPEEAALAYDKAALKFFGEYARLNFPQKLPDNITEDVAV